MSTYLELSHEEICDMLVDFTANELETTYYQVVEQHLEGCEECRRVVAELRSMRNVLKAPSVNSMHNTNNRTELSPFARAVVARLAAENVVQPGVAERNTDNTVNLEYLEQMLVSKKTSGPLVENPSTEKQSGQFVNPHTPLPLPPLREGQVIEKSNGHRVHPLPAQQARGSWHVLTTGRKVVQRHSRLALAVAAILLLSIVGSSLLLMRGAPSSPSVAYESVKTVTQNGISTVILDNTAIGNDINLLGYVGKWQHCTDCIESEVRSGKEIYNDSVSKSPNAGDTVNTTFNGAQMSLYAVKGPEYGIVAVSIDGGEEILIDLYAPQNEGSQMIWQSSPNMLAGQHILTLRVTGNKNPQSSATTVALDRVDIRITPLPPGTPPSDLAFPGSRPGMEPTATPTPEATPQGPIVPVDSGLVRIIDTAYPIPADAFFVAPDGQDTNTGRSVDSPWSVAKALKQAPDRSTIVFRGGTYRTLNKVSINKRLTLQPYPHEQVWIKGSVVVSDWVNDGGTWRKDNWTTHFPRVRDDNYIDADYPLADNRDMLFIDGVSLKQVGSKAEVTEGTFFVDYKSKQLFIGSNPGGKQVEATAMATSLGFWQGDTSGPAQSIIRGLGFTHYADHPLWIGAPGIIVENNTFVWNGVSGLELAGHKEVPVATDVIVRSNIFSYNGRRGLGGGEADRMLLENNIISYNNIEHYATNWDAAGIKAINAEGIIWRNNLVENNYATGMWMDINMRNATVVQNVVRNNASIGIFFEISRGAIIAGNLSVGNGTGIMISHSSEARIYNNTLVNNRGTAITVKQYQREPQEWEKAANAQFVSVNTEIKNNLMVNSPTLLATSKAPCTDKGPMISVLEHNAYISTNGETVIKWSPSAQGCEKRYGTFDEFRAATNLDQQAVVLSNADLNALFENVEVQDYRLKPGSPATDRGAILPEDIATTMGWPTGRTVNLGAF